MTTRARASESLAADLSGRDRILLRAAQLFLERGYAETSLRTIADAVDMRPASIYHHFESKDALLAEILDIGMHAVMRAFDEIAEKQAGSRDGQARLTAHVTAHLEALFAHHAFTAAHVTVFPFVPAEVRATAVKGRDRYEAKWAALVAEIAPGLTPEGARLARLGLFGAMNSTVQWFDPTAGSLADLAEALASTLWNGFKEAT